MKRSQIVYGFILIALLASAFWIGSQWRVWKEKVIITDRARWMARYWEDGRSVSQICEEISREQSVHILQEQWALAEVGDALVGPVVSGQRICVRRDRWIYWRPAQ